MTAFAISQRYLVFPVQNGAERRRLFLSINGVMQREFDLELADRSVDFWVYLDVSSWRGCEVRLESDSPAPLEQVKQAEDYPGNAEVYHERLRPQFHFTSRRGWNNDPNGLLYYKNQYHLFYQHNPFGVRWGNMHWGHAVSADLVHWQEVGEALYPDAMGVMFSGSGLVDWRNTAGFQRGEEKPLVLAYTAAGGGNVWSQGKPYTQCLAFSADGGQTWEKYAQNPVLSRVAGRNRDPKIIWHAPSSNWVMALYLDQDDYALFTSPDLKTWSRTFTYQIPGSTECPDLFELALDGDPGNTRWVLWGASTCYLVGQFDGTTFTIEETIGKQNNGGSSYAAQTWSDIPAEDGRCIQISWLRGDIPGMPFNQQMTFPLELTLRTTPKGIRLFAAPVREIEAVYQEKTVFGSQELRHGANLLAGFSGELLDIEARIDVGTAAEVRLEVHGVAVVYDTQGQSLRCKDHSVEMPLENGRLDLRILVDRASLEVFAGGGRVYLPLSLVYPEGRQDLSLTANGGSAWLERLELRKLRCIW
jgi:sucrose-6-phosphate hydrolase SacC (GH32 family)